MDPNTIQQIKLFLYEFYTKDVIDTFCELITEKLDVFNIEVNYENKSINIKIKKTNLKKLNCQFVHDSVYYQQLITPILYELFIHYSPTIATKLAERNQYYLYQNIINESYIPVYFNIITHTDGIFTIYL